MTIEVCAHCTGCCGNRRDECPDAVIVCANCEQRGHSWEECPDEPTEGYRDRILSEMGEDQSVGKAKADACGYCHRSNGTHTEKCRRKTSDALPPSVHTAAQYVSGVLDQASDSSSDPEHIVVLEEYIARLQRKIEILREAAVIMREG